MIEAVYIIKDSGILFDSRESESMKKRSSEGKKDIISAFFSAINTFSNIELGEEGIDHIRFLSNKYLYFKEIKISNQKNVNIVVYASGNGGKEVERMISSKIIEIKWIIQELMK